MPKTHLASTTLVLRKQKGNIIEPWSSQDVRSSYTRQAACCQAYVVRVVIGLLLYNMIVLSTVAPRTISGHDIVIVQTGATHHLALSSAKDRE